MTAASLLGRLRGPRTASAQRELVEALGAHAGLVLQSAARVLGSLTDAEDVAQDIAEKLLRSPPSDVRSWPALLRTLAVNRSIDRLRRRREAPEPAEAFAAGPEQALQAHERAAALRAALAGLPERDASLFSLHYFGDLSHAEIGEQLDLTANAVGVALHRLRKRLAVAVAQRLGEPSPANSDSNRS